MGDFIASRLRQGVLTVFAVTMGLAVMAAVVLAEDITGEQSLQTGVNQRIVQAANQAVRAASFDILAPSGFDMKKQAVAFRSLDIPVHSGNRMESGGIRFGFTAPRLNRLMGDRVTVEMIADFSRESGMVIMSLDL